MQGRGRGRGICKFFAQSGSCKKGDKCEFQHVRDGGGFPSSGWNNPSGDTRSHPRYPPRGRGNSNFPNPSYRPGGPRGSFEDHKAAPYCRGFHRGDCTNLQHTNHTLPPGIERKTFLDIDQGQGAEQREVIGLFKIGDTQFGACTDVATYNIWDNSFMPIDKKSFGIPCSAVSCFTASNCTLLVFGTYIQTAPAPNQYGIYVTDGTNTLPFPVSFYFNLGESS